MLFKSKICFWKIAREFFSERHYFKLFPEKKNDLNLTVNKLETKLLQQSLNYSNTTFLLT